MAVVFAGQRIYQLWQEEPWGLPQPILKNPPSGLEESKIEAPQQLASTSSVIDRNLFDPERGASRTKEAEASSIAMQRIRSMVLLGTAILGNSRYAILEGPMASRAPAANSAPAQQVSPLRLKLGDTVEGFRLSEIHEKKVVFTRGTSRIEVNLDYFRAAKAPAQPAPPPVPRNLRPPRGVPVRP